MRDETLSCADLLMYGTYVVELFEPVNQNMSRSFNFMNPIRRIEGSTERSNVCIRRTRVRGVMSL